MGESLSKAQTAAALAEGDEIEFDDDGHRRIEGFSELVAELRALVEAQRANAGADMLRSESQSELIALLQKVISRPISGPDMAPLTELLTELVQMKGHAGTYQFTIERDNRGFMTSVVAAPTSPTLN